MKLFLTGSEGLIGKALKDSLHHKAIRVQGYDHKLPFHHPDYGTILDYVKLEDKVTDCDGIIHLAAVSRVIWGEKDPVLCWQTNFEGTQNVLRAALNSPKRPWFLYASSREVYGNQKLLPVKEDAPLQPINIYGRSKAAAEEAVLQARSQGMNSAIARFSNVYGATTDHRDRVIPAFCSAAAVGGTLRVEGSQNTFDFTHVTDVVAGILKIIEAFIQGRKNLPPLHFTAGRATSLNEAAGIANEAGGGKSDIIEAPSRTFDVSNFCGDATSTMNILGWHPQMALEEGIKQLVSLFKKEMGESRSVITTITGGYHNENTQSDPWLSSAL